MKGSIVARWFGALVGASGTVVACGPSCGPSYPAGTRFTVTVDAEFAGCHGTFDKGHTYHLVASAPSDVERGDGASCESNYAMGAPVFSASEYSVGPCYADPSLMGTVCEVMLPGCEDPSNTLRATYSRTPEEPGDAVAAELRLSFAAGSSCERDLSCSARIPVTIRW